ncbi:MAG: hypothetical protein J6A50_06450 [Clostridia bacterium]|nr:hypothetical protein [Clostridia bacterium]
MGDYNYKNIGYSVNDTNSQKFIEQIFDCFNITNIKDYDEDQYPPMTYIFAPKRNGNATKTKVDAAELFNLLNGLFSGVYLYYEEGHGSSVDDSVCRIEEIYDPVKNILSTNQKDYSEGGAFVFGESIFYVLREEIEEEANKKGIEITWTGDYDEDEDEEEYFEDEYFGPDPDNDDFYDLCEKIMDSRMNSLCEQNETTPIAPKKVSSKVMQTLISNAEKKGYSELVAILKNS